MHVTYAVSAKDRFEAGHGQSDLWGSLPAPQPLRARASYMARGCIAPWAPQLVFCLIVPGNASQFLAKTPYLGLARRAARVPPTESRCGCIDRGGGIYYNDSPFAHGHGLFFT